MSVDLCSGNRRKADAECCLEGHFVDMFTFAFVESDGRNGGGAWIFFVVVMYC